MTRTVEIVVHVIHTGRATALLEDLAVRLRHDGLVQDEQGYVRITFYDVTADEAWDRVRAALDKLPPDRDDYLQLSDRPAS
jgi:hypothetical protein